MKSLSCPKCGYSFTPKMSLTATICGKCGLIIPHDSKEYEKLQQQVREKTESR